MLSLAFLPIRHVLAPAALLAATVGFTAGCGNSGPKRYKVTGSVTYKGNPIPSGTVTFTPEDASLGVLGGSAVNGGQFEIPQTNGLVAGKYKVSFSYPDPKGPPPPKEGDPPGESRAVKELLPAKYSGETELRAEVTADGPNNFPFDLK